MTMDIRRVVTGRDTKGTSLFTSAGPIEVTQVGGMALVRLWGTGDEGARVGTDPAEKPELFLSAPGTEPV